MIPLSSLKQGMTAVVISGVGGQQDTLHSIMGLIWILKRTNAYFHIPKMRNVAKIRLN
jgi:hypothetical protein